jgi:hypothetical protein
MVIFEYCPILGLKNWKFIGESIRVDPVELPHKFPSSKENSTFCRTFKTQHKANGRITKPTRGEDE